MIGNRPGHPRWSAIALGVLDDRAIAPGVLDALVRGKQALLRETSRRPSVV